VRSLLAAALLAALGVGTGCMPLFPPPPGLGLSKGDVNDIVECQDTINRAGRKFVERKLKELENCALGVLELRLAAENELIDEDKYFDKLESAADDCLDNYEDISDQSTVFVDKVIQACEPVEEWILDGDSLRFLLASEEFGYIQTGNVEELAGSICFIKELFVDQMIFTQMPRLLELLEHLEEFGDFIDIVSENDFPLGIPDIPLDERCFGTVESEVPF
jgi:hypothetical protein